MDLHHIDNGVISILIPFNDLQTKRVLEDDLEMYPIFEKYIDPNKSILDIGACVGTMSVFFSKKTSKFVHAFEPMKDNFRLLQRNCIARKNIILHNFAIGNENAQDITYNIHEQEGNVGMAQFYQAGINDSLDKMIPHLLNEKKIDTTKIKIKSIDNLPFDMVDCGFIKLDVEGFELPALIGAKEFIKEHQPNIFIEIHSWDINNIEHNYKSEIFNLFHELNYKVDYTFKNEEEFIFIPK